MTNRFITFCFIASFLPTTALAQGPDAPRERLSLTTAIQLATEHNRQLEASKLQIEKAEDDLAAARTKRLPLFESTFNASQLLTPVSYSFPKGAFGDLPGIGPYPTTNVDVKSPSEPNAFISSQISQPLSQLIRINLGIRGAAANRDIERERSRQQRLAIVNAVSKQYFAILQTTSALTASEEAIALYRELDRTIAVRVVEKVALKSDAMDVQLRLAQEELTHMTYVNTLASQKEQLNQLLGRDVRTPFDVDDLAPLTPTAIDLDAVQARALQDRPDIREARLKLEQADLDRRMKRSERIPDVSLAASYVSNFNIDVLPRNLSSVGVQVKWEPFDWGRKGRELASKTRTVEQAKLGGLAAIAGRVFTNDDDTASAASVAVISYRYWQRRFGLDAAALGSTINVNGIPVTIVGVVPPEFTGLSVGYPSDIWIPMAVEPRLARGRSLLTSNGTWWLLGMGRLKPGVTEAQARANLDAVVPLVRKEMGIADNAMAQGRFDRIEMQSGASGLSPLTSEYSLPIRILMIIVGLVLLIACANVANLLLSRASARQREMAIRLALGGGRTRLLHQLLIESLLLAAMAGALGLIIAAWSERALVDFFATQRAGFGIDLSLNTRVLTFTVIVSLLTGVLFGLLPALRATRLDPGDALKQQSPSTGSGLAGSNRMPLSRALIVLQVAISLLLLGGAGLFVRTLQNLRNMDFGFNPEHVLLMTVEPSLAHYDAARQLSLYREALDRFNAVPGVQAAGAVRFGLINGGYSGRNVFIDGVADKERNVAYNLITPRFLEAMGIARIAGRDFNASDTAMSPKVAIVNEKFARYYFGTERVIGQRIGFDANTSTSIEIIGVVRDTKYFRLRTESPRTVWMPVAQAATGTTAERMTLTVRTAADPVRMASTLTRELQTIARDVPIRGVKTMEAQLDSALSRERLLATLSTVFGGLALLLACIGLYGVMSYAVIRRTTEIGIRMALGARRGDVIRMVLRDSAWLVGFGIVIGLAAFVLSARYVESQLFLLKPTDPVTLTIACALQTAAASIAAFVPAWRAARVDPLIALRYE